MRIQLAVLAACIGVLSVVVPALAHHSTAMYDMANPVTVTGTVTRFEWTNPHAVIYLDVKNDKGESEEWEMAMMSLNHLRSYGWTRSTVKPGDKISCTGGVARSGKPLMFLSLVELADGRKIKS